jgi:hypothetical protein
MRRRAFITLLGAAGAAPPLVQNGHGLVRQFGRSVISQLVLGCTHPDGTVQTPGSRLP